MRSTSSAALGQLRAQSLVDRTGDEWFVTDAGREFLVQYAQEQAAAAYVTSPTNNVVQPHPSYGAPYAAGNGYPDPQGYSASAYTSYPNSNAFPTHYAPPPAIPPPQWVPCSRAPGGYIVFDYALGKYLAWSQATGWFDWIHGC